METIKTDVLVVGAGPAGSTAAAEAARCGLSVILIERRSKVGEPVQCAEFVPRPIFQEIEISSDAISSSVSKMVTYLPSGKGFSIRANGCILNRDVFDRELAEKAKEEGVDLLLNTSFVGFEEDGVILRGIDQYKVDVKIIIAADGPLSTVGREIGNRNREFVSAIQYSLPLTERFDQTEIYFNRKIYGGYGWLFPKGDIANVGVGVKINSHSKVFLRRILDWFVERLKDDGKVRSQILSKTSGLIPVSGILQEMYFKNILFVGDACGMTHSITGQGICQAVIGGKIAGRVAAKHLKFGTSLSEYKREWMSIFGEEHERARRRRRILESRWDELEFILPECWIGFRDYYR
ncbi:MAG: NAD(P)/FAD-dependent oxidoreductase [bacterium]|nr:NAD(P)/FAD-dependent oxidoreductase [bacterium]